MENNCCRILIIDDNSNIYKDFQSILLEDMDTSDLDILAADYFGDEINRSMGGKAYDLDYASQGKEGVDKVKQALVENRPFALAFVDMRMPPGWDGLETIENLWKIDNNVQIVICTAYSDHSWGEIVERVGKTDKLLILKKPFDSIEVAQLSSALTEKWSLARLASIKMNEIENRVKDRTLELAKANEQLQLEIEERIKAEEALIKSESKYRLLAENINDVIWTCDMDMNLTYITPSVKQLTGYDVVEVMSQDMNENFMPHPLAMALQTMAEEVESEKLKNMSPRGVKTFELEMLRKDGATVWTEVSVSLMIDQNNHIKGFLGVFHNIANRKLLEEELRALATTDPLTGVNNRRSLLEKVTVVLARARRYEEFFSVLMIDIDNFKQVNDTFGHQVGDKVIKAMSETCMAGLRETDIFGRMGGDEFAAVLVKTDMKNALSVAEQLRHKLSRLSVDGGGDALYFTVSIGVSTYEDQDKSIETIMHRADIALYNAKNSGRNHVVQEFHKKQ